MRELTKQNSWAQSPPLANACPQMSGFTCARPHSTHTAEEGESSLVSTWQGRVFLGAVRPQGLLRACRAAAEGQGWRGWRGRGHRRPSSCSGQPQPEPGLSPGSPESGVSSFFSAMFGIDSENHKNHKVGNDL